MWENFIATCEADQNSSVMDVQYSLLDLFKTPRLRRITIILVLFWGFTSLVFDGYVRNISSLGLNAFITFTLAATSELPANLLLTCTLDMWGRRWYASSGLVLSGVFSILAAMVPLGPPTATLALIGRFFINISYSIGLQYATELLPTVVRAQGVAFVHIMGYVASIIAPHIVYLAHISPAIPLVSLGICGLVGGMLVLFLPETLHMPMPQTLADGEKFGRDQKFCHFPCISTS